MLTEILSGSDGDIRRAAEKIKHGGLVAMPTETVYGLAANALDRVAVANIFTAKGRAQDNPLIVHISELSQLAPLVSEIPDGVFALAQRFWSGPLTMIMKKSALVPDVVTCGMDTVAIRMPSHPIARKIIDYSGCPIAAPSANLSGGVSPTTAQHCIDDLMGRVDAIIDGGSCSVGLESTVVLMCADKPRLLRPGFITLEQLESVIGEVEVDDAILHPLKEGVRPSSPGMKYKHYSPKARVVLVDGAKDKYIDYVNKNSGDGVFALCFDEDLPKISGNAESYGGTTDGAAQASKIFELLRELDTRGASLIYAHMPSGDGVGLAVLNRLLRAAAFEVITL